MAADKGFQVDRRVVIAMDALTSTQRAILMPMLRDKESFIRHASSPGSTERLLEAKPVYVTRAGTGLRIIYSKVGDDIIVLDIMLKATMDQLATKEKGKAHAEAKGQVVEKGFVPTGTKRRKTGKIEKS